MFLISSLDFFAYDRSAETLLRRRMENGESWNIVHAVTPVSPAAPTRLHRLGLPLIIGPLNGGWASLPPSPGGAVLLEAMAAARPVIAIAYGGPAEVVDDHVGRAILPDGSEAVIEALVKQCARCSPVQGPGDGAAKRGGTGLNSAMPGIPKSNKHWPSIATFSTTVMSWKGHDRILM